MQGWCPALASKLAGGRPGPRVCSRGRGPGASQQPLGGATGHSAGREARRESHRACLPFLPRPFARPRSRCLERTGAAPPPCPRAAAVARVPSAPQGTERPAADDTLRPRRLRSHGPKGRTLTWTPSMRSSGGRAPPRPDSISGRSAGRPLPLLSRSAPPRPALGGTRPGHAPRLGSSAWTAVPSGSQVVHRGRASGRRWGGGGSALRPANHISAARVGPRSSLPLRNSSQGKLSIKEASIPGEVGWAGNKRASGCHWTRRVPVTLETRPAVYAAATGAFLWQ